jgi:hypothetical protein
MDDSHPLKLYAYVDESGQDTEGRFFVVSVVLIGEARDTVLGQLAALEERSGKGRVKWRKARYAYRQAYIDGLAHLTSLSDCIFMAVFNETRAYFDLTVEVTARAIRAKVRGHDYRMTVFVDGLTRQERPMLGYVRDGCCWRMHEVRILHQGRTQEISRSIQAVGSFVWFFRGVSSTQSDAALRRGGFPHRPQRRRAVAQAVSLVYTPDRGLVRIAWTPGFEEDAFGSARRRHAPSVRIHPSGECHP